MASNLIQSPKKIGKNAINQQLFVRKPIDANLRARFKVIFVNVRHGPIAGNSAIYYLIALAMNDMRIRCFNVRYLEKKLHIGLS